MHNLKGSSLEAHRNRTKLLISVSILLFTLIITYFGIGLLMNWNKIDETSKSIIMGYITGGTLSIGALSLTILAYSFSEIHARRTTKEKAPFRRLAMIAYTLIPLSFLVAFVSAVFNLTKATFSFEVSIIGLFAIILGLVIAVNIWVTEELLPLIKTDG